MISRDKAPTAQETFMQMAQAAGLRGRLLLTLGILMLIRLGIHLPIPGIDRDRFAQALQGNNQILSFLDIFSGGGLSALGVFALGILPYINASIIIQLLTAAIPALENLQKNEGEAGRRKISQMTRYVSAGWAVIQSVFLASFWLKPFAFHYGPIFVIETALALVAGSMFVMWASEVITERGVGNGASLLIFVNIVATLPKALGDTIDFVQAGNPAGQVIALLLLFLVTIVGIVFVQEGIRRIPIISARRQVGKRIFAEQRNYLPLRLNQGGVMPIIFAAAILSLPMLVGNFIKNPEYSRIINTYLVPGGSGAWVYALVYLVSIVFFSYFYSSLIVNPVDVAQNLKKMGSSIPGIRPGKATTEYIERVLNRLTFLGAIFLGLIAIIPTAVESALNVRTFRGLGATSLLILVGVAIDTSKQIQTYVISQRYEGMVKQ
ncbi:MAG: preprotein translocase subunit SecY [Brasilonema octagenarum HA4186-MV1]|jgi:preprotein translocase subunit SecY|uniref:Protein translocase subunit SecY n=2 Tax=Brasilonema TaxID=383614 RepID=A0A856MCJ0_9CYAN|nr:MULTISPECIES: preprotein translocase subunit SecY [Brasilonema]MBW4624369.1 preprotein translocase subunit SecY [Brasilonema octagenarum HA4186-MV1]NMF63660.1 preprotein translocase subunit SecY [Brasilonema octagenarum UFV-OR1]QDL09005.1 preprotein translocase subunit SecY [Brasilonema sennae CENA114]QDL15362.1 preprotein translocase subunit SecY [Brasilonema octagenarum UFV-E1]